MTIEQKLLKMKEQIDNDKREADKLEGQLETFYSNLKSEFSCDNIEDAEKKQNEITEELTKLNTELESGVKDLEEKHDWNF